MIHDVHVRRVPHDGQVTGPLADAVDPDQAMTAFGQFHLAARDIVRRDTKGRVTLGKLGTDSDGFRVYINDRL
jgi:hypothetical protein